jgi:hypothetical protein
VSPDRAAQAQRPPMPRTTHTHGAGGRGGRAAARRRLAARIDCLWDR